MSDIRERLKTHRKDALILLQETSRTAQLYEGFRLAGAVSHLARAQALLAEELEGLGGSEREEDPRQDELAGAGEDATPVDGIHR